MKLQGRAAWLPPLGDQVAADAACALSPACCLCPSQLMLVTSAGTLGPWASAPQGTKA